jgi:hypothetical protein
MNSVIDSLVVKIEEEKELFSFDSEVGNKECVVKVYDWKYYPPFNGSPHKCDSADDYHGGFELHFGVYDDDDKIMELSQAEMNAKCAEVINMIMLHTNENNTPH